MLIAGFCGIIAGKLSDRYGPRKVVTGGGLILGVGYLLSSTTGSLWQLNLYFGFLVAVGASTMYIPLVSMLARWFSKRRSLMAGIGISGIGLGTGVVPAIASQLILAFNWRSSLIILGITNIVLITLLAQLLKRGPEVKELQESRLETIKEDIPAHTAGTSFRDTVKTGKFWMLCIAWLFYGFFFQVGIVHIVPYATDIGMSAIAGATILTTIGIVGVFGRISLGFSADKFGIKKMVFLSFGIMAMVFLGLAASSTVWMLYIFAAVFGWFAGIGILLAPLVAEDYGFKAIGVITGVIAFSNSIGNAISPIWAGYIFDTSGSYQIAFTFCGILGIAASLIIWLVKRNSRKVYHA